MSIKKAYYLAGILDKKTGEIKIYSGGHRSSPIFCQLGKGLGKAYTSKKLAQNRLEGLEQDYKALYRETFLQRIEFKVYRVTVEIEEEPDE